MPRDLNLILTNLPPGALEEARGVNAAGMIVGNYVIVSPADGKTYRRPFLLLPSNTTLPDAAAPPTSVSDLNYNMSTQSTAVLSWVNNAPDANGIRVLRASNGVTFYPFGTLSPTSTTFSDGLLAKATRYTYRVMPYNVKGYGAYAEIVVTTPGVPSTPTNCSATALSKSSIRVRWTNQSNAQDTVTVQYALNTAFSGAVDVSVAGTATEAILNSLSANTTYYVRVRGNNSYGSSDWSNTATVTTPRK
jgi:hypothetical protein